MNPDSEICVATVRPALVSDVMTTAVVAAQEGAVFKQVVRVSPKARALDAAALMTRPAITVAMTASIIEAARLAAQARVHILPVVDRSGGLIGAVSRSDLLRVHLRPGADIRRDVELSRADIEGGAALEVGVGEGVVTLTGMLATRSTSSTIH